MIRYLFLALLTAGPASAQTAIARYPILHSRCWLFVQYPLKACQAATSATEAEYLSNPWYQTDANAAAPVPDGNQIGASAPSPDP
jgi:hypothetical protein